jgi:hypothetical protein
LSCGPQLEPPKEESSGNSGSGSSGNSGNSGSGSSGNSGNSGSGSSGNSGNSGSGSSGNTGGLPMEVSCLSEGKSHEVQVNIGGETQTIGAEDAKKSKYLIDYYKIPLILRGKSFGDATDDAVMLWTSKNDVNLDEKLKSDSTLQVRFLVYGRASFTTATNGQPCPSEDQYLFKKLKIKAKLYGLDGQTEEKKFLTDINITSNGSSDISVGSCSDIVKLTVPGNSERFVIEINDAYWDFFCENKDVWGYSESICNQLTALRSPQCVNIEVQVSTDKTLKLEWPVN